MNKVPLLAACAALTLVAAACGDDDDDASDGTAPATVATPATAAAPAATAAAAEPTTAGTGDPSVEGSGATVPPWPTGEIDPDVAADCEAIRTSFTEVLVDAPEDPAVGDEITDEYKDFMQSVVDALDDLDLSADEVQDAVDGASDFGNNVLDAEEWTEELQAESQEALNPVAEVCAAVFITQETTP